MISSSSYKQLRHIDFWTSFHISKATVSALFDSEEVLRSSTAAKRCALTKQTLIVFVIFNIIKINIDLASILIIIIVILIIVTFQCVQSLLA